METVLCRALRQYRTLSIVGMGKNAGKTTVLNRLVALLEAGRVAGVTSIGRDGETVDIVTGTKKPAVHIRAGMLVATAASLLGHSDVSREILDTTGVYTPLGEVVLLRALSDGTMELAGPSMAEQLTVLGAQLLALGAEVVLIDGAVGRKSLAAPAVSDATILCAGASYSADMDVVIRDAAYACTLLTLPRGDPADADHVVDGAVTDAVLRQLSLRDGDTIVIRDGSRMLLPEAAFDRLRARGIRFEVLHRTVLCCVCINPFSARGPGFDAGVFERRMAQAVPVPVLNVCGR